MENNHTYETAIARLKEIVTLLENSSVTLDESVKLFEEGAYLADFCNKCLTEAEQKITELTSYEKAVTEE